MKTVNTNGPVAVSLYTSPLLGAAAAPHTVQFVQTGNPIYIDSIQVDTVSYMGTGTYDGSDLAWAYNGIWSRAFVGAQAYNSTVQVGRTIGGVAEFPFNGTGFTIRYMTYNTSPYVFGKMKVYVDNVSKFTVNTSGPFAFYTISLTGTPLPPGNHLLQILQTGPAGSLIAIDSVAIP
jgi:hypothetical protein